VDSVDRTLGDFDATATLKLLNQYGKSATARPTGNGMTSTGARGLST